MLVLRCTVTVNYLVLGIAKTYYCEIMDKSKLKKPCRSIISGFAVMG